MTAALFLLAYAVLGATLGGRVLRRASWPQASPQWGVVAWQALTASVAFSGLLAAVALALCMLPLREVVAHMAGLTPAEVSRHYEPPPGDWVGMSAIVVAAGLVIAVIARLARTARRTSRARARQHELLTLVGTAHSGGFTVIETSDPVVYCLPGRRPIVVVSRGALELLDDQELGLVLGHERLHLRARHHIAITFAGALADTFKHVALFAEARDRIVILVEMQADDAAHAQADRRALARALVKLSSVQQQATLAAGGTAAVARVTRLAGMRPRALSWPRRLVLAATVATGMSIPVGLALAPAFQASTQECCSTATAP